MNAFLERKLQCHGRKSEKRFMKSVGARTTPGSGALPGAKSDGYSNEWRYEAKSTVKASISIKLEVWRKIIAEATQTNKRAVLALSFVNAQGRERHNGDLVIMSKNDFIELNQLAGTDNCECIEGG